MLVLSREEVLEVFRATYRVVDGEGMPHATIILRRTVPAFCAWGVNRGVRAGKALPPGGRGVPLPLLIFVSLLLPALISYRFSQCLNPNHIG